MTAGKKMKKNNFTEVVFSLETEPAKSHIPYIAHYNTV